MRHLRQLQSLLQSSFLRAAGVLVSGTVIANLITALALPVLTRLYTPADFSDLAVLTALISILSVAIALRFDVAVPLPQEDGDAANLAAIAIISVICLSGAVAAVFLLFPAAIFGLLQHRAMQALLVLVPLGVLFAGAQSVFQFWMVRTKRFSDIAKVRITQSSVGAAIQLTAGLMSAGAIGLLAGPVMTFAVGAIGYLYIWSRDRSILTSINRVEMRRQFMLYSEFPRYSALESLANTAAIQMPILMIAALAAKSEAGFLLLGMAAMQAPMALIGSAVAQVYLSKAPEEHRAGRLAPFTADVLSGLIKSGVGPILFTGIVAPEVFSLVFGEPWRRSGVLVAWMTPWFVMQFLASPVSTSLLITGALKSALALQVFGLVLRVTTVAVVAATSLKVVSEAYAVSGLVFYFVYLLVVGRIIGVTSVDFATRLRQSLPYVLIWVAGGVSLKVLIVTFNLAK